MNHNCYRKIILLIFLALALEKIYAVVPNISYTKKDSVIRSFKPDIFISCSFIKNSNWKESKNSVIVLSGNLYLNYTVTKEKTKRINELRAELQYQKFIDSIWIKSNDNLMMSSIWVIENENEVKNSFNVSLKTQMTDTWDEQGAVINIRKWKSGPMLPSAFIAGYGLNKMYNNYSYINVSFAAIKINARPKTQQNISDKKIFIQNDKLFMTSEYGLNLQCFMKKKLFRNIKWENKTNFFATGLDKKVMTFEVVNTIYITPFRLIKVKAENKIGYDYFISDKLQVRYELLFGLNISN